MLPANANLFNEHNAQNPQVAAGLQNVLAGIGQGALQGSGMGDLMGGMGTQEGGADPIGQWLHAAQLGLHFARLAASNPMMQQMFQGGVFHGMPAMQAPGLDSQ